MTDYSGTFVQKKVLTQVPDAFVYVNGSPYVKICPKQGCNGQIDVNDYVTSINTSLSNNTTVGTAGFSLSIPKHGDKGAFVVRGGRVFGLNLMDEIDIYFKARFPNFNGEYQYHRAFWGVITNIEESYSAGSQTIQVNCESILKWLQIMKTNEHFALNSLSMISDRTLLSAALAYGKSYANLNVYEIIQSTVDITYLNIVVPNGLAAETAEINNEKVSVGPLNPTNMQLIDYWRERFKRVKASLKMFGTGGIIYNEVKNLSKNEESKKNNKIEGAMQKNPLTAFKINYDPKSLFDFRPFAKYDEGKAPDTNSNTYKNNLEIISETKSYIGFEFYMDTTGDLVFKPPFFNLDTRSNKIYTLEDIDIINYSFSESEAEVVTRVEVSGSNFKEGITDIQDVVPRASYTNYNLARQFGLRSVFIEGKKFKDANFCYYFAISEMDRINADRYKGSVTIIGRPELRLSIPVYMPSRDTYGYIDNISHTYTPGGQFTTSIQLSAIRRKYTGEDSLVTDLKFNTNGNSFGFEGKPCILIYSKDEEFEEQIKTGSNITTKATIGLSESATDKKRNEEINKGYKSGLAYRTNLGGIYKEFPLNSREAQEALKILEDSKKTADVSKMFDFLGKAILVSDDLGYELIGTFDNGRTYFLDEDNILRKRPPGNVSFEAFSTNLYENQTKNDSLEGTTDDITQADARASKNNIESFLVSQTKSIRDLAPSNTTDFRRCSCYDPSLTQKLKFETNTKRTISQTSNFKRRVRNDFRGE
jgi:hypothetical protein